ncbi:PREDICTED: UPF0496 protein At3g57100-like isoform X2 [Tarenaya hassleriana]|uniref:UPF0496 protein At3g57100-like isoform X1 n=1 Tax=Tarenaya hassleriana TaxID=28532 RepID=UPI00053C49C8|nr:PREDICTED: UPF0496 protein At3g57100-like isoform X1 [Tarenaya hassleriana]XP_010534305.1 PREDICTED: UPF0496 protein At3g57100-like isoform X2 [Tarenaya hassleriana]
MTKLSKIFGIRRRIPVLTARKRRSSSSPSLSSRVPIQPQNPEPVSSNGLKIRSASYDSLSTLTGCIDTMNEDVRQLFLSSDRDLRKNPDLLDLANDFFNTNAELYVLCESLKKSLGKADLGETLILHILSGFVEEKREEGNFSKTLQNLRSFKDFTSDDPFAGEFTKLFKSCHADLVKVIGKLNLTTKKLNRKLRRIRRRRRVTITLFLAAVATVVISAVLVGVAVAPPVLAALGAAVSFVPMGSLGVFISTVWLKSRNALKRQKAAITSMERGTCLALSEVAKISGLVNQFEDVMKSMEETVDSAAAEKKSRLEWAMGKVEKDLLTYRNVISVLRHEGGRCDQDARLSRDVARDKITQYLCE